MLQGERRYGGEDVPPHRLPPWPRVTAPWTNAGRSKPFYGHEGTVACRDRRRRPPEGQALRDDCRGGLARIGSQTSLTGEQCPRGCIAPAWRAGDVVS